ncbi:Lrp/AsnC family transcriptional regulator [Cryobacterium sp. PH29-G1]|uniref:Lrp/AsnC family transcriptional regulator n=1 Tax=Cryobacterium sp. PH29-G1 TaxID=3046211 RepID=UPI0024B9BA4F|nr:Lrp/AsnC family transcriptional regulator [Cryobacterium sp. PH29-G1]MDJ0348328.1 Lrp/AsnC family transcriptional regulator [Cryobacterium sp. PH29-G1]
MPNSYGPSIEEDRVIDCLRRDGRASYSSIAEELGLTRNRVSEIVKSVVDRGQLRFTASANPRMFGFRVEGHLHVSFRGDPTLLYEEMIGSSLTTYVSTTTGDAGLCVQVRCRVDTELVELLAAIREHPEVLSIQVHHYQAISHNVYAPTLQAEEEYALDETDMRLVETLERDGRAPVRVLAAALGLPESSVRHRMTRLMDGEIIRVVAVPRREFGRAHTLALGLGIRHTGGSSIGLNALSRLGVEFMTATTGDFGIIATAVFSTLREANDFVEVLRREPWVTSLSTWLHMQILKEDYSIAAYRHSREH